MKTRLITSAIAIIFCILLMIFGEQYPLLFIIAISLANAIMCFELLTAKKLHKNPLVLISALLFAVSMPGFVCTEYWYLPLYIYSVIIFFSLVFHRKDFVLTDIVFAYGGTVLISLSIACLVRHICFRDGCYSFYLVSTLAVPWLADSAAYFVGRFLGKHKLCPSISPHKTVEGAVGGAFGAVLGSMLIAFIFQFIVYKGVTVNFPAMLVYGAFCAVASVLGDLTFSVIKRECKIKDYGTIMPGHGGLLDRFDSVIFCVPFAFFLAQVWSLMSYAV